MQSNHSQIFISLTLLTFVGFSGWIIANDFSIYVPSSDVVFGSGTEQCDDGNNLDGDGCSSACQNENLCDGSFPDGELDNGEECDDGNGLNTDACDNYCRITICGDRIIQSPNGRGQAEVCDDGNSAVGDGCNSVCTLEIADECGNWVTDGTEDCDDGKRCNNNGDPCYSNADCYGSGTCGTYAGDGCGGSGGTPPEVCDNSTDDDCDGDTDCDDSDCTSHPSCFVGAPASCDYCTACENSYAETWTMTFDASGVTGSCGSADCSNYTGTFYLRMHDQASYSNCNCDGGFCWSDAAMNNDDCNNNGNKWTLTPNVVTDRWELVTGGTSELVTYYKAGGLWDCDGTNILTLDNSNIDPMCSGWPSSVTLTPSASNVTCQSGKTCGNSSVEYDTNTSTYEECDDGNTTSNDGCSNACLLEWWYLPGSEVCDNGTDDDSDSLIDCEDPGCPYGHKCGANGLRCASGSCACPGGTTESNCTDTNDNDCDGSTDCADSDCSADPACGGGGGTPEDCDAAGDEDGDGDENCADSDCPNGTTCAANGMQCASGSCTCPGGSTETACDDLSDNDCDGSTDCSDADCSADPACGGGGGTPEDC
ncbi:DUF4215 domain-containing protein, partial [Candidatus Peribacteria bacterium]|nr:DUF4215 domain-containing protein [Candidatus Peribacteria bacterium]